MEISEAFSIIKTGPRSSGSPLVGRCQRAFLSFTVGYPSPIDPRLCDQHRLPDCKYRSSQGSLQTCSDSLSGRSDSGAQSSFGRPGSVHRRFTCHSQVVSLWSMAGDSGSRSCDLWTWGLVFLERVSHGALEWFRRRGAVSRKRSERAVRLWSGIQPINSGIKHLVGIG